ncbi:DNA alkylation repair protein [Kaarinaea lacus]
MKSVQQIQQQMKNLSDPQRAAHSQRFFKTGAGEYGEGDVFLGIKVPQIRQVAKQCLQLDNDDLVQLITSRYHEVRLLALLILVYRFPKATPQQQKRLFNFYIKHKTYINNWDLVDCSAPVIVGAYLFDKDKDLLYKYARHKRLWDRRIAIMANFYFIKQNHYSDALKLAEILLQDDEDLIQKAVGWMLREIGKRDLATEEAFLQRYYQQMPRTMLRYAIEKFTQKRRHQYLSGAI